MQDDVAISPKPTGLLRPLRGLAVTATPLRRTVNWCHVYAPREGRDGTRCGGVGQFGSPHLTTEHRLLQTVRLGLILNHDEAEACSLATHCSTLANLEALLARANLTSWRKP